MAEGATAADEGKWCRELLYSWTCASSHKALSGPAMAVRKVKGTRIGSRSAAEAAMPTVAGREAPDSR